MTQVDDLTTAVATLKTNAAQAGQDILTAISDLQAAIAAAKGTGTLPDISSQISDITTVATGLASLDTTVKGDDPGAPAVTPPPAS